MNIQQRIELLARLGKYMAPGEPEWEEIKSRAFQENSWFIPEFINLASTNIVAKFLDETRLYDWASHYNLDTPSTPKNIGLVMAGNLPLVGFHDFLCVFIAGHRQTIKLSSKDSILLAYLLQKCYEIAPATQNLISVSDSLKGCNAYIATGSNRSARHFEYYFSKYPHIIRHNKTSVAILTGKETKEDLENLADDICLFFGFGCRNVTKLLVPEGYNFDSLLTAMNKYGYFIEHNKYANNYDYRLAILMLDRRPYITNGSILLSEASSIFSPISMLHYEYYKDTEEIEELLKLKDDIQCIAGSKNVPYGNTQLPSLFDYADGVDTMSFLSSL